MTAEPTLAEQRETERRDLGYLWLDRLRAQLRGEADPAPLTRADEALRKATT